MTNLEVSFLCGRCKFNNKEIKHIFSYAYTEKGLPISSSSSWSSSSPSSIAEPFSNASAALAYLLRNSSSVSSYSSVPESYWNKQTNQPKRENEEENMLITWGKKEMHIDMLWSTNNTKKIRNMRSASNVLSYIRKTFIENYKILWGSLNMEWPTQFCAFYKF